MKRHSKNLILALVLLISLILVGFTTVEAQTYYYSTTSGTQVTSNTNSVVVLNGNVNPNGYSTTAWFEYSTDMNFYSWNETTHVYVGSTYTNTPIKATVNNLVPNTVYYFRIVTNNGRETIKGNILSFTTSPQDVYTNNTTDTNTNYVTNVRYVDRYVNAQPTTTNTTFTNQTYQNQADTTIYRNITPPVYTTTSQNVASPILVGVDFLPNNLGEWLIFLIILFAIILIIRELIKPRTYIIQK